MDQLSKLLKHLQASDLIAFLFILVTKLLSRMVYKVEELNLIHEVKLARIAPAISHLLFVDDLILFCCTDLMKFLMFINAFNGIVNDQQQINYDKFGLIFSRNMSTRQKCEIKKILNMKEIKDGVLYLNNPMFLQWSKVLSFEFLKVKIENKLSSWKSKLLFFVGRVTLVKSKVAFMLLYTMLAFKVPNLLCKLDATTHNFLWKGLDNHRKCSFVS